MTSWTDRDAAYSDAVNRIWGMVNEHEAQARNKEGKHQKKIVDQQQKEQDRKSAEAKAVKAKKQKEAERLRQQTLKTEQAKQRAQKREVPAGQSTNLFKNPILWGILGLAVFGLVMMKIYGGGNSSPELVDTTQQEVTSDQVDEAEQNTELTDEKSDTESKPEKVKDKASSVKEPVVKESELSLIHI